MAILRCNAPINVNPAGGWGSAGKGRGFDKFLHFLSNSPGSETKGQSKNVKKALPQGQKNQNKQYYNTISGLSLRFQVAG